MNQFWWVIAVALLAGCAEPVVPAPREGDTHQLPPIEWRIRSREEIAAVYVANGRTLGEKQSLEGFVGRRGDQWVIYTSPPRTVDDQVACTLGHEVMHVALGNYHKEAVP